jgi:hypothetical protein
VSIETKENGMQPRQRSSATLIVIILFAGLVFAGANLAVSVWSAHGVVHFPLLMEYWRVCPPCVAYFVAAPLLVSILLAIMVHRLVGTANRALAGATTVAAAEGEPPSGALRLLALLQQEGRLVDFLQENIDSYDDAQVGAAVRSIHAGCRKALAERLEFRRIFEADEGNSVAVEKGFDPNTIRLSGNVTGEPPFRGTLQHGGWRVTKFALPESSGDATVIAPAEVEIP